MQSNMMTSVRGVLVAGALGWSMAGGAWADDRHVVVPTDDQPFTVQSTDVVRLSARGISGSRISAKVEGPAKVDLTSIVTSVTGGRSPIGSQLKEFDLKPTGHGKVTVVLVVTPPQPDAKPVQTKYVFTVE